MNYNLREEMWKTKGSFFFPDKIDAEMESEQFKDKSHLFKYSLSIVLGSRYLKMKETRGRIEIFLPG